MMVTVFGVTRKFMGGISVSSLRSKGGCPLVPSTSLHSGPYLSMSTTADEVAEYISDVHVAQLTRMCQMAPYVVMLYDHLLTFDQEVELVWKRSWTLSTVLYVILRYAGGMFGLVSAMGALFYSS
ncbi:hypothetical protein HYDPIDRAFT_41847 [Hydnomerulius pinastri MD-312]|uniref:DUF6533 domain-containing protein n=1 Tax=Hydnomerulius pinastri MD-312 TaxID=994086 RepID=A0A0C9VAQ5_9AGAM|nr:hypothetical protein HYDPIDRAFT_41847 [Hydnomerulius pinastri MD-312]